MSKQTFDFSEALKRMKQGQMVRRAVMPEHSFSYIEDKGENIRIMLCQLKLGKIEVSQAEYLLSDAILATDWEEVEE